MSFGFSKCPDGTVEVGYEKVVIYSDGDNFRHIAKQQTDGSWSSKLGRLDDISHSVDGLLDSSYGTASIFMKRTLKTFS